jgi:hypothetical protein
MNTIYFDPPFSDKVRREQLYEGQLVVLSPRKSALAFSQFAKELIKDAFAPLDPETAQHHLPVEKYAQILGTLKPTFIHHPESKKYLKDILCECGCDLDKTYYEVPKLRSSTSDGYLTTGIAYAWHPHRDTWTAAPPCQINWWIPVYELSSDNAMTFFPQYWDRPVKNSSSGYNYYLWNKQHRGQHVTKYLKEDPRPVPRPTEAISTVPEIRLICPVGGMILFSGAHLHASVPNTSHRTRFSFDFRTVQLDDVAAKRGAPNIDSQCKGHMLRDYIRSTDLAHIPEEYMAQYDDGSETTGELIYQPLEA